MPSDPRPSQSGQTLLRSVQGFVASPAKGFKHLAELGYNHWAGAYVAVRKYVGFFPGDGMQAMQHFDCLSQQWHCVLFTPFHLPRPS